MGLAPDHLRREALNAPLHIALLTGGNDKHYAVALASALRSRGVLVDFIGSTDLDCEELHEPGIRFLDLRGEQNEDASWSRKVRRILAYYFRLIAYAASAKPQVFHILWNNKFDLFDRTLLMAYYRLLGKRVAFTAHNVNAAQRDSRDGWLNRLSLRIQYTLCDCIFVHTARMKQELVESFGIQPDVVEVIPYGINVTIPTSGLTAHEAREQLGLADADRVLLFFGQIAPYKGLDLLLDALRTLAPVDGRLRLVIAGKVKQGWGEYWRGIQAALDDPRIRDRVVPRIQFIADEEIEQYFKAADVLVLPYTDIFQSGVLFLAYSFGLPVIVTDVGSLRESVIEGKTGLVCPPRDPSALARTIERYFATDIYGRLDVGRDAIRQAASSSHSWAEVSEITEGAYVRMLPAGIRGEALRA